MHPLRILAKYFGVAAFVSIAACGSTDVPYGPGVAESTQPLWADTRVFWSPGKVPVCWQNPSAVPAVQLGWVKAAVARSWSFAGNLEFTGWGTCAPTSSGVRIQLQDDASGPRALGFGTQVNGISPGLILDHTFQIFQVTPTALPGVSLAIACTPTTTGSQLEACIENIAIHEFGHILGFHHEQNAPGASSQSDFPASCPALVQPTDTSGNVLYKNDWDLNSVMNYCSPAYGGPKLSSLDFGGMMYFYGMSPRFVGALVGAQVI